MSYASVGLYEQAGLEKNHDKSSAVSYDPLSHSRHSAGDRRTKVGHEINTIRASER